MDEYSNSCNGPLGKINVGHFVCPSHNSPDCYTAGQDRQTQKTEQIEGVILQVGEPENQS